MLSSGKVEIISTKYALLSDHSCMSEKLSDLLSALVFSFPAMCTADTQISLSIHQFQISFAKVLSRGDLLPPMLLI